MNSILAYLKIYCFGNINGFIGSAKTPSGETSFGHLMYGSIILHTHKPKKIPEWLEKGTNNYISSRVFLNSKWITKQISITDSLPTDNTCNLSEYYGFISCLDGREKKFSSKIIGKDTSFKFKKKTDTGNVGRACSTQPGDELIEIEKFLGLETKKGKSNRCLAIQLKLRELDSIKHSGKRWFFRWSEFNLKC